MGPPLLYWLGTNGWCFSPCVCIPLPFAFVFLYSHAILPFLPCLILLCVSYVHAYPPWHERRGLLGLYNFPLFPCGLGHWLGKSPYLSSLLGFYSCYFSSYYAYEPTGYHSCHVGPLGLLPIFLGFSGPFTLLLLFCYAYGSVDCQSCHIDPLGLLSLSLDFPSPFTLLLPLVVPIGPLAVIPDILAHWANYLFPWASLTHLFYFYLLLCLWTCWLSFLPYWPIGLIISFLGFSQPIYFTSTSCGAYGPIGYHSYHIGPLGLLPLSLGFFHPFTLLLPFLLPCSFKLPRCRAFPAVRPFVRKWVSTLFN